MPAAKDDPSDGTADATADAIADGTAGSGAPRPLEAADEGFHAWPTECDTTWKENWYWNLADRSAGVWGFFHTSFVRTEGKAVFAVCLMAGGRIRYHRNEIAIGDQGASPALAPVLDDATLRVEIVAPHEQHRVRVRTADYSLDLDYRARFAPFSYSGRRIAANRQAIEHLRLKRYEQGMTVRGTCTLHDDGREVAIDCLGHRDHSWGRRDEGRIDGWNWAAVQLPSSTINLTRSFSGDVFNVNGFVSTAAGNVGVVEVDFETLEMESDGRTPLATRYTFRDENGAVRHLRSRRFSDLFEPVRSLRAAQKTVIFENFADYELEETGEKGWGIDEYQRHYR
ncbi:MAG TPA: hypothetical protein VGK20_12115 [Candidatus Binatia bacterium]|jgi:hypothetical protein